MPESLPVQTRWLPWRCSSKCKRRRVSEQRLIKVTNSKFRHLYSSPSHTYSFILCSIFPTYIFILFQGEDEGLEEFLAEDREAELCHFKTSQAETRKLVCDALQVDWGRGEVVSPKRVKDLILQVTTSTNSVS